MKGECAVPEVKDPKTGKVMHYPYTKEGIAAAEAAKKPGGKMKKGKRGRRK